MAHPRRVRSFIGVHQEWDFPTETQVVRMGLGDRLVVARGETNTGLAFSAELSAAVFAEFDLAVSSFDFFAADFFVGLPFTVSKGPWWGRARVFHQSSHLGDDILSRDDIVLEDFGAFDYEALDVFVGYRFGPLQPYAGGEYRFRRTPRTLDNSVLHAGAGWRIEPSSGYAVLAGGHAEWSDDGPSDVGILVTGGIELRRGESYRPIRILLEGRWGSAGAGRFFRYDRRSFGVSVEVAGR